MSAKVLKIILKRRRQEKRVPWWAVDALWRGMPYSGTPHEVPQSAAAGQ
jgi:hypothetical protein